MKKMIILTLLFTSASLAADKLTFKLGKLKKMSVQSSDWKKGVFHSKKKSGLVLKTRTFYNMTIRAEKTYDGFDFHEVMSFVYGESWRKAEKIVIKAKDGFTRAMLIKTIIDSEKKHLGLIAIREKGRSGFTKIQRPRKSVDPGDFYLLWSGFKKGAKHHENSKNLISPYQLKEIRLVH